MSKLLIVSDSNRFRAWARLVIEAEGYAVIEARDGLAALQYAVEDGPMMILIDPDLSIGLVDRATPPIGSGLSTSTDSGLSSRPGLSASDVQRRLMREPQTESIPVVVQFSAFVHCAPGEGSSARAMRRSTATLSLRETISNVMCTDPMIRSGASLTR